MEITSGVFWGQVGYEASGGEQKSKCDCQHYNRTPITPIGTSVIEGYYVQQCSTTIGTLNGKKLFIIIVSVFKKL